MKTIARSLLPLVALAAASVAAPASADQTVTAVGVEFDPMVVYVEPGESVTWTQMNAHNVETLADLIPEGGVEFNSEVGADYSQKFDEPGIFVYKCTPHWGARMGGIVVVGKPEDAGATMDAYLATIDEKRGDLLPAKGLIKKGRKDMEEQGLVQP